MQNHLHDIATEPDVKLLVDTFYTKVRHDDLLFPVFDPIVKNNWDSHLRRMCEFWSTLLLYTRQYTDDPLKKHIPLPISKIHFDRWLQLFDETLDELFNGPVAENAKKRASSIARIMKAIKNIPEQ